MKSSMVATLFLLCVAGEAQANPLGFEGLTNNNAADVATGEAQLRVTVINAGSGKVSFKFENLGPKASSITDIYFDDSNLLRSMSISEGPGTSFDQWASPGNLPGWNLADPDFKVTTGLSADSDPPVQKNGVNPGEYLTISFRLKDNQTFQDVLDDLKSGDLRIGIHVQGFTGGGSESFINTGASPNAPPSNPVPEPATLLLMGAGLVALGTLRRGKRKA